jgi:5-methylcytosine-specific restriction enzyme subunit McrC
MLTYTFRVLKQTNYDEIASENFSNIHNLFAAILSKGIAQQLKQGLHREYMSERDSLTALRGKLEIYGTFSNKLMKKASSGV